MALPENPIPLSVLQHWAYCPRQCCLIHLEQAFDDNLHTLRGNAVHGGRGLKQISIVCRLVLPGIARP